MLLTSTGISKDVISTQLDAIETALLNHSDLFSNPSYETGALGLSLFYYYLARFKNDSGYSIQADQILERTLGNISLDGYLKVYKTDSLDNHLSNIGRFLYFGKENHFFDLDLNDFLGSFDDLLFTLMKRKGNSNDFDYNSGLLAGGYYFLKRAETDHSFREHLSLTVNYIYQGAQKDDDGDFFWSSPSLANRVYIGISHGSAMLVSYLCNVYHKNIDQEQCLYLIRKAVNFIIKQKRKQEKGIFPIMFNDEVEPKQFALSYGDLGTAFALLKAAQILKDEQLDRIVNDVLDDCLTRKKDDNLTLDAGIIYGAAGLSATFEKLHQLQPQKGFEDGAAYWYNQIPKYAIHENEFAGYKSRLLNAAPLWNVCFGWGIAGIGVSLMLATDRKLPAIADLLMIA